MFGHLLAALGCAAREMVEEEEEEEDGGNRRCEVKPRGRGVHVPAGREAEIYSLPTWLL